MTTDIYGVLQCLGLFWVTNILIFIQHGNIQKPPDPSLVGGAGKAQTQHYFKFKYIIFKASKCQMHFIIMYLALSCIVTVHAQKLLCFVCELLNVIKTDIIFMCTASYCLNTTIFIKVYSLFSLSNNLHVFWIQEGLIYKIN